MRAWVPLLLLLVAARPAPKPQVYGPPPPPTPYDQCDQAIDAARPKAIPPTLLGAIARVESGRLDPAAGRVRPWPWTINVEGTGYFHESKEAVIAAVQAFQARGIRSIDVGCMQVNLLHHPNAFPSLEAAFDPAVNAAYAVRFLLGLHAMTRDWGLATAMYHSATQERGEDYQRRVFGKIVTPMGPAGVNGVPTQRGPYPVWPPPGTAFAAIPPASYVFGAFAPAAPAAPVQATRRR